MLFRKHQYEYFLQLITERYSGAIPFIYLLEFTHCKIIFAGFAPLRLCEKNLPPPRQ